MDEPDKEPVSMNENYGRDGYDYDSQPTEVFTPQPGDPNTLGYGFDNGSGTTPPQYTGSHRAPEDNGVEQFKERLRAMEWENIPNGEKSEDWVSRVKYEEAVEFGEESLITISKLNRAYDQAWHINNGLTAEVDNLTDEIKQKDISISSLEMKGGASTLEDKEREFEEKMRGKQRITYILGGCLALAVVIASVGMIGWNSASNQNNSVSNRSNIQQSQVRDMKNQVDNANKSVSSANAAKSDLQNQLDAAKADLDAAKKQASDSDNSAKAKEAQIEELQAQVDELNNAVQETETVTQAPTTVTETQTNSGPAPTETSTVTVTRAAE